MAPIDQKTEVVAPAEVPEDLPLPADPKVIFLGGLFVLAVLVAAAAGLPRPGSISPSLLTCTGKFSACS